VTPQHRILGALEQLDWRHVSSYLNQPERPSVFGTTRDASDRPEACLGSPIQRFAKPEATTQTSSPGAKNFDPGAR